MRSIDPIDLATLDQFVPLNALTKHHLQALMRTNEIRVVCAGSVIFQQGDVDGQNVYLLYGKAQLIDEQGQVDYLEAGTPESLYPVRHQQPRKSSMQALTDCWILSLPSDKLDNMLCWDQAADYLISEIAAKPELDEDADWIATLLKSNLFYQVPPMNIEQIFDRFEPCLVDAGETLIRQGEIGEYCYVIKEGTAEVWQAADARSKASCVATLEAGRCFGEEALINNAPRNATVTMRTAGVLMRLHKKDFQRLLDEPVIGQVTLPEAQAMVDNGGLWLDVRSQFEYEQGHFDGALNFPLNLLKMKSRLLDKKIPYVTYCDTGRRSIAAACLLGRHDFQVVALSGGLKSLSDLDLDEVGFSNSSDCVQRLQNTRKPRLVRAKK